MTTVSTIRDRVAGAGDLAEFLDAVYEAFEEMLAVASEHDEPGGDLFAAMVMASASAASGRDHLCHAPSLPPRPLRPARGDGRARPESAAGAASWLGGVSRFLAGALMRAAKTAGEPGDQVACVLAAVSANGIAALMAGQR